MKIKFSTCIKILIILVIVAYGIYVYWINTDHSKKTKEDAKSQAVISTSVVNSKSIKNTVIDEKLRYTLVTTLENTIESGDTRSPFLITNKTMNTNSNEVTETNDTESSKKANHNQNLKLYATSALLMDASNNRVLYEKNGYKEMPMASTTKIMTLIVTLENANLNETVKVSKYAASMPDVQLGIREGEQYKLKDLVYSLMLESHNDVAVAIAEHVGGSVQGFAKMMNTKAKELGCLHTSFVTPNGLDADNHYTTAEELAKIGSYAIKNEEFIKITNTASYSIKEITNGRTFTVTNKDKFLYLMDGAIGIKTGFTGKAGYCFVGALERENKKFVSVVLACGWPPNKSYKWHDSKLLMDYGLDNYSLCNISTEKKKLNPIIVIDGVKKQVPIKQQEVNIELLMSKEDTVKVQYVIPENMKAPIKKNAVIGYAKYYVNDKIYEEVPIFTTDSVKKIDLRYCLKKIFNVWNLNFKY